MAQPDCPLCGGTGWKTVERAPQTEGGSPSSRTAGATGAVFGRTADRQLPTDRSNPGPETSFSRTGSGQTDSNQEKRVWAVPCDCTGKDRTARTLNRARIPSRYEHCDFDNFDTGIYDLHDGPNFAVWNRSIEQGKLVTETFARDYPAGGETGLLLMGPCGAGKTHLAVAALRQIVLRGHAGLFYDYRELLKEIQGSYNAESQTSELGILEPVLTAEVLLLDDLGAGKPSQWALETVGHILNTRYNEKRVTLLTTNYLDPSMAAGTNGGAAASAGRSPKLPSGQAVAPAHEDSLEDRLGKRIRSRLYEMCRTVELCAPDYRREIRQAGRIRS